MVQKEQTIQDEILEDTARTFYGNSDVSKTIAWLDLLGNTRSLFFYQEGSLLYRLHSKGVVLLVNAGIDKRS